MTDIEDILDPKTSRATKDSRGNVYLTASTRMHYSDDKRHQNALEAENLVEGQLQAIGIKNVAIVANRYPPIPSYKLCVHVTAIIPAVDASTFEAEWERRGGPQVQVRQDALDHGLQRRSAVAAAAV